MENPSDQIKFVHTGIRIMQAENGDLLFCDPGAVTGVRDSLLFTAEMREYHPEWLGIRLLEYIAKHDRVRGEESISFKPTPTGSEDTEHTPTPQ